MSIVEKFERMDVRYIYLFSIVVVAIPLLHPVGLPIPIGQQALSFYGAIDRLQPGSVVFFTIDGPSAIFAEIVPQAIAVMKHLVRLPVKIVIGGFVYEEGVPAVEQYVIPKVDLKGKRYGVDYVNLGFLPGSEASLAAFAADIHRTIPKDYFGTSLNDLPIMANVKTLRDINLVVAITGGNLPSYLRQWQAPYKVLVCCGTSSINITDFLPFYASGQIVGLLNSLVGAAEYETLVKEPGMGIASSDALSLAHLVIIMFVVIGNLGYLVTQATARKEVK
jgi:hypothetical protein